MMSSSWLTAEVHLQKLSFAAARRAISTPLELIPRGPRRGQIKSITFTIPLLNPDNYLVVRLPDVLVHDLSSKSCALPSFERRSFILAWITKNHAAIIDRFIRGGRAAQPFNYTFIPVPSPVQRAVPVKLKIKAAVPKTLVQTQHATQHASVGLPSKLSRTIPKPKIPQNTPKTKKEKVVHGSKKQSPHPHYRSKNPQRHSR